MINTNQIINLYLGNKKVPKHKFDDLKLIAEETSGVDEKKRRQIFDWFRFLQKFEIVGWRPKPITRQIIKILSANSETHPVLFYALFCPSYRKGVGAFGFRTDDVGNTTKSGIKNLLKIWRETEKLGFCCQRPLAIFFDIAIEQADKVLAKRGLEDLEKNIINLNNCLAKDIKFTRLSMLSSSLFKKIGYKGAARDPLPIPDSTFNRIVGRGKKFYQLFGWTDKEVIERSRVIATSEALVGEYLKKAYPRGIMVYTPTMLERGAVYSGMHFSTDPLPIIFPKKEDNPQ